VISLGLGSLVANAQLVQKVYFSRIVLPLSVVGSTGYNWLFEMGVLLIALTVVGGVVWPWIPLLLVIMVLLAAFAAGIALMLSIANVYFRDTQYFLTILLQLWMYLTPIIYPASMVEVESDKLGGLLGSSVTVADIYHLNPMDHFVNVFRQLIYDNRWPDASEWLICTCWAVVSFTVGVIVFRSNEKKLAEAL
jgi:lipopolysaccharide transport system permease protein